MNILFVNYHDFSSNSAIHIFYYANHLAKLGVDCGVCVPQNKETISLIGEESFSIYNFNEYKKIRFSNGAGPDLIHAWTPRDVVDTFTRKLAEHYNCPFIIHFEDNEYELIKAKYKISVSKFQDLPDKLVSRLMDKHDLHPKKHKKFLNDAVGFTAIMHTLLEFKPSHLSGQVIWPGYDNNIFYKRPVDVDLKAKLNISDEYFTIVYNGNVHHSNKNEVYSLYLAVAALNRSGVKVKLVRTGRDFVIFKDDVLNNMSDNFIELGFVDRSMLPNILSIADVLVQPGKPDAFNKYRFPSKLPEFFAMGKPVILPNTNIGQFLLDGINCMLLHEGSAIEIAEKMKLLFVDQQLREKIGDNGRLYAEEHFNWSKNTKVLYDYYQEIISIDT